MLLRVTLNKGQVYQVQALKTPNGAEQADLSMTEIISTQPIGVLAGDKCTDVPVDWPACDILLDMMLPTTAWGTEYFTYPFDPKRSGGDLWRIFPLTNTKITLNGQPFGSISPQNSPAWMELDDKSNTQLNGPCHWQFSNPVMMVQYITSLNYDGGDDQGGNQFGDPADVVLEPREEFTTGAIYETPSIADSFNLNFVNVFIDGTGGLQDSLYVDDSLVQKTANPDFLENTAQIPGTNYWVYHISVPPGVHTLSAQTPFSAYAVGYRNYDAYAWACQMGLKILGTKDTIPPLLEGSLSCGELDTSLTDLPDVDSVRSNLANIGDNMSGIGWLYNGRYPDSTYNFDDTVFVNPGQFVSGDSSWPVHIQVKISAILHTGRFTLLTVRATIRRIISITSPIPLPCTRM